MFSCIALGQNLPSGGWGGADALQKGGQLPINEPQNLDQAPRSRLMNHKTAYGECLRGLNYRLTSHIFEGSLQINEPRFAD